MNPSTLTYLRISICTLLLAHIIGSSLAQKEPILHDKKFSFEIENELKSGDLRQSSAAYYYTYIGETEKALNSFSLQLDWGLDSISNEDSILFSTYKPVDAYSYLEDHLSTEQLVIISEAHQMPQHRIFTKKLLKSLYENGFRHLGLETLSPSISDSTAYKMDRELSSRGYPLNSPLTGHYTREPQMGNLVREALRLGFKVFGYERTKRGIDRDLKQAQNIKDYMDAHQGEKVVIHCGWYHAIESDYPKRKKDNYMAYHLKQMTKIDPFTIYQDALSQRPVDQSSPYYEMVQSSFTSILLNRKNEPFHGFDQNHFDIFIYHPPNQYIKNRPHWLYQKGIKELYVNKDEIENLTFPLLIEAVPQGEQYAVPIDIIEWPEISIIKPLLIPKGKYRITVTDAQNRVIQFNQLVE